MVDILVLWPHFRRLASGVLHVVDLHYSSAVLRMYLPAQVRVRRYLAEKVCAAAPYICRKYGGTEGTLLRDYIE